MFSSFSRRLALSAAALAASVGCASAAPAYVNQASSDVYWGSTGAGAVMILRYDNSASSTLPVTVTNLQIADASGNNITTALYNCGTIVKSGDTFVGHQILPGQDCYLATPRGSNGTSIHGTATLVDSTGNTANVSAYIRTMLEIRDASGNVLTHVEVH